jgi:hypothetical protein
MSGFSPKVTASTVAAGLSSVVGGIVGPYVFPDSTPADVKGLWLGVVSAAVAFGAGFLTKHPKLEAEVDHAAFVVDELARPFSQIPEWVDAAKEVTAPVAAEPAPVVAPPAHVVLPPAQPTVGQ